MNQPLTPAQIKVTINQIMLWFPQDPHIHLGLAVQPRALQSCSAANMN